MYQGRYVKDNHFTEIYVGNGMKDIVPVRHEPIDPVQGLQYFRWEKEKVIEEPKKSNRDWIWWSVGIAVFLMGASFGAIMQNLYYCIPLFLGSMAYIALVAVANSK